MKKIFGNTIGVDGRKYPRTYNYMEALRPLLNRQYEKNKVDRILNRWAPLWMYEEERKMPLTEYHQIPKWEVVGVVIIFIILIFKIFSI